MNAVGTHGSVASVGLVGLGLVGTALGRRIAAAGLGVLGFDRDEAACDAWRRAGCATASSLREVGAACRRVVLAVYDTGGVLEVVEGRAGLLGEGANNSIVTTVVDCSTGNAAALEALAARLAARGVEFIEAPLAGSSRQIAEGAATMLLGGSAAAIAANAPLLDALSPKRIQVGGAGMGARAKLATNLVLGLNRAVLAEGFVFAETLGMAPATFLELVLATPARSDAALAKGAMMASGEFTPPQSRIHQHLKDVRLMLEAARATGRRLPLTEVHAALLDAAVQAGDGDLDNAAIIRQLRRERTR
jgi:3-hydroxyisobutyrate dehydrogenase-like beta-hydroxyacid dehydrogenase